MALEGKRISELTEVSRVNKSSKLPIDTGGEEALSITLENLMESGVNAAIETLQFITWVDVLPPTGSTKYLYAVPREEVDKDGHKIAALYLWDGTEWRGAGAFSLNIDPDTLATKTDLNKYLPLSGGTLTGRLTILKNTLLLSSSDDSKYVNISMGNDGFAYFSSKVYLPNNSVVGTSKILGASDKAVANGVASLDENAKVPSEQIPIATTTTLGGVKPDGTTITTKPDGTISATGGSSSGHPLGEVFFSQSNLATDNPGALPGWTGEYYENGKTLFPDLYNFVKAHSELQVTKEQYDNAIATYGECPKYVIDENTEQTSLRLPKYANYIKMANSTEGITQKGAGLPNITGSIDPYVDMNRNWSGALEVNKTAPFNPAGTSGNGNGSHVMFDASKSNAIYGASDTVQPAHTTLYPWVCAFNAAVPASTAQAAEFTGALTGKANTDLSNVLENIDYVVESVVKPDGSWCRKYKSHWLEQGGFVNIPASGAGTVTFLKPFADTNYNVSAAWKLSNHAESVCITAMSKTEISFDCTNGSVSDTAFWEAKGMGVQSND